MNNNDRSISLVGEILKKRYNPELYEQEQAQKKKETQELLAYVEGLKAALALQEKEKAKEEEIEKSKILFVTDPLSPRGWRRNH